MRREWFDYELPEQLIAFAPTAERRGSRLLKLDGKSGALLDGHFPDVLTELRAGDVVVFNNTRVIPARLLGRKVSGGQVEVLVERILADNQVLAHVKTNRAKVGTQLLFGAEANEPQTINEPLLVEVTGRCDNLFYLQFDRSQPVHVWLERYGHVPLPPYIARADEMADRERYQTVYAKTPGAVAAPTAGLHFDDEMLAALEAQGVAVAFVTLHVGAGTFQPVKADDVRDHNMHSEWLSVSAATAEMVNAARARGGRVVAVGTTSVRSLETAADDSGVLHAFEGDTRIFIYPGYRFKLVDALITNFHLPESTLLMLVSAFAGYRHTLRAYRHAVAERYRFFSYGDAMWVSRNPHAPEEMLP